MNSDERFSIGELSKATGINEVTIRYYEQVKLMSSRVLKEITAFIGANTCIACNSCGDAGIWGAGVLANFPKILHR